MEQGKPQSMQAPKPLNVGVHREGSPYTDQECEDIIGKLEQMLDGELDMNKEKNFVDMVNSCEYCLEQYKIEKSMRKLIKTGFKNVMVSNDLVNNIKQSIQAFRQHEGKPKQQKP
jgi:anti-sigma factor (TIGR02949 family)